VLKGLGEAAADTIDWLNPRLICIAGDFTKYDESAIQQINRNISLFRYSHFDQDLLMLDLVNATASRAPVDGKVVYKSVADHLESADEEVRSWYESIKALALGMGDDVQFKETKLYFAFKRIKNFACVEIAPQARKVTVYVKLPITEIVLQEGFTRDVSRVGHFGTGNIEIVVDSGADVLAAQPLIQQSYERN